VPWLQPVLSPTHTQRKGRLSRLAQERCVAAGAPNATAVPRLVMKASSPARDLLPCAGNDPHERVYQRFKFSSFTPSQDAPTAASADDIPVGRIEVELCEVVDTGRLKRRSLGASAGPSRDPQPKLAEGKKWFMAPGLKVRGAADTVCVCVLFLAALHLGLAHVCQAACG
jgi:hypothetical protein